MCQLCINCINNAKFVLHLLRVFFCQPLLLTVLLSLCPLLLEARGEEEEPGALTTVQQSGQNHQRRARASSRNRISRAIARMEPSDCGAKKEDGQQWGRPRGRPVTPGASPSPPSHCQYADSRPEKGTASPNKWMEPCPASGQHTPHSQFSRETDLCFQKALLFALDNTLRGQPHKGQSRHLPTQLDVEVACDCSLPLARHPLPGDILLLSSSAVLATASLPSGPFYSGFGLLPRTRSQRCPGPMQGAESRAS